MSLDLSLDLFEICFFVVLFRSGCHESTRGIRVLNMSTFEDVISCGTRVEGY